MRKKNETRAEKVFKYIIKFKLENGYAPTVRDVCKDLGIKSTSTAFSDIEYLKTVGKLKRTGTKSRSIILLPDEEQLIEASHAVISHCETAECESCVLKGNETECCLLHIFSKKSRKQ